MWKTLLKRPSKAFELLLTGVASMEIDHMQFLMKLKRMYVSISSHFRRKSHYSRSSNLKPKKLEDLQKMIPFFLEEHTQFYHDLLAREPSDCPEDSEISDSD